MRDALFVTRGSILVVAGQGTSNYVADFAHLCKTPVPEHVDNLAELTASNTIRCGRVVKLTIEEWLS